MAQRIVIPGFRKIETSGGGEGGTGNYNDLTNKPSINNVPLVGNLKTVDLKLTDSTLTEEGVPADAKVVGEKLAEQAPIDSTVYQGVDLTVKFANEIKNYSDEWAWIKARITASNYTGLHVCDYIPITCNNGYKLNAQIAGMNTYTGYADQEVGTHIDFICKELWEDRHVMNKVDYNNGNANSPNPFLASDLNYWLNSMSGAVPNSKTDPAVTTEVDYTVGGVLYYLPDKLKNQIVPKSIMLPSRYTAGQVLKNDNSWSWQSTGKLWIPSEVEVYGMTCWGNSGYGAGRFVQYPIFIGNMNRAKKRCSSKEHNYWWLLSTYASSPAYFTSVGSSGFCGNAAAPTTWVAAPVCFRI